MPKPLNLVGQKFHRLTVISRTINSKQGNTQWTCLCNCGNKVIVIGVNLNHNRTKSCGCLNRELLIKTNTTHGLRKTPEYRSWSDIIQRCLNPNNKRYNNYGGRGIKVCQHWNNSFEAFIKDMRFKPTPKHSIERINNNGNYEPSNCKWATSSQQARNTRRNQNLTFKGKTLCVIDWCQHFNNTKTSTAYNRLKLRWPIEKIFSI